MAVPLMAHIAAGSSLLPFVVGLFRYKKLGRAMKVFTAFSLVGVLNIAIEFVMSQFTITNYFISDVYFLIQIPVIALVYYLSIMEGTTRLILKGSMALFILIWVVDEFFFAVPDRINNTLAMIAALFLIVMSSLTLNAILKSAMARLTQEAVFWILTGTIIYSSGSFAVIGLSNELLKLGLSYFVIGWYVNWILFIVSMVMFSKGLMCKSQA